MLNTGKKREVEGEASLDYRRLKCIARGDLNWIGKGFLAVIKKDCQTPDNIGIQKKNQAK